MIKYLLILSLIIICVLNAQYTQDECNRNKNNIKWDYMMFVQIWPGSWISSATSYKFNNTYFTIHGLWPEFKNGSWPQYCYAKKFNLTSLIPLRPELDIYWTDFKDAEKFWKHEYKKHLSCAIQDPQLNNEYQCFKIGLEMRKILDLYHILKLNNIVPSNSKKYSIIDIYKAIYNFIKHSFVITCDYRKILTEIRVCIDSDLNIIDCPNIELKKCCSYNEIFYNYISDTN